MTLLNHIGILVILLIISYTTEIFAVIYKKSRLIGYEFFYAPFLAMFLVWLIFEVFYWTIKIFF